MSPADAFWASLDSYDNNDLLEDEAERRAFDAELRAQIGTKQSSRVSVEGGVDESIGPVDEESLRPLTRAQVARRIGEKSKPVYGPGGEAEVDTGDAIITQPVSTLSTPLTLGSGILVAESPVTIPLTRGRSTLPTEVATPVAAPLRPRLQRILDTPTFVESPVNSPKPSAVTVNSPTPQVMIPARKNSKNVSMQPLTAHQSLVADAIKEKPKIKGVRGGPLSGMVFFFPGLEDGVMKQRFQRAKTKMWYGLILEAAGQIVPEFTPEAGVTHIIWENEPGNGGRAKLCTYLGIQSLDYLPKTIVVVKLQYISECKKARVQMPVTPYLSFPPPRVSKERKLAPLNTAGISISRRTRDITVQMHAGTPSQDSTDSQRHKNTRQMSPGEIRLMADQLVGGPMGITSAMATNHQAATGSGWKDASPSKADGLDEMIAGVSKGIVDDEGEKATGLNADSESGSGTDDDDGDQQVAKRRKLLIDGWRKLNTEAKAAGGHYKCMQKNDGTESTSGPNEFIAKKLDELHKIYEVQKDKNSFSMHAYHKAAGILRRTDYPVRTKAAALELKGIGDNLATRIEEIATDNPKGRGYYEDTEKSRTSRLFAGVYGIGAARAEELYNQGARTLEDLRTERWPLTYGQITGLYLYDDLQERIPRTECLDLFTQIQELVHKIDPKVEVEIMGSYRRGSADSGDVDILLTRDTSDGKTHAGVLPKLLQYLFRRGIFTHSLSEPSDPDALEAKWMGVAKTYPDGKHRRVDLLCIPFEQRGAALIYFTGNDIFNRSLRLYARKHGYSLNQRGLYKGVIRNRINQQKETEGVLVASSTEQEIFDVLGIRWRPPHERRP